MAGKGPGLTAGSSYEVKSDDLVNSMLIGNLLSRTPAGQGCRDAFRQFQDERTMTMLRARMMLLIGPSSFEWMLMSGGVSRGHGPHLTSRCKVQSCMIIIDSLQNR